MTSPTSCDLLLAETRGGDDNDGDMWMPDVDELIADDQAVSAAAYDELEDNDYMMMMQDAGADAARGPDDADDADGRSGEGGDAGNGRDGREIARDGDSAGGSEEERAWRGMMGGYGDEGAGGGGISVGRMTPVSCCACLRASVGSC